MLCLLLVLVFCCAARNRLVCRQRNRPILPLVKSGKLVRKALKEAREAFKTLIASTKPATDQVSISFNGNWFRIRTLQSMRFELTQKKRGVV